MCGIVGVWRMDGRPVDVADVLRMRDTLVHRGPDDAGVWAEDDVALGHRRLSIIDLSEAGRMPMGSKDGQIQAVFNGEIYNFLSLRRELESKGHSFRSDTDSEVVLRAYEEWSTDCFRRFSGMFAIAIWDGRQRRMVLGRDPVGQKPLSYAYRARRWLLFASTLAPFLEYAGAELDLDQRSVEDYVRFGFPPDGKSMLEGVRTVPPGSLVVVENGKPPRTEAYFDLVEVAERRIVEPGDERALLERFRDLMRDAVRSRMVADVPLGAFLSGGLDSSLVVALMAEYERDAVKTYTIGFDQPEFDESQHAAQIASHLGVENTIKVLRGRDVLDQLPDVVRYFDEPMADYSVLPTLAVSKLAREHVTVALTGDGADEEFGGYRYYVAQRIAEPYVRWLPQQVRSGIAKGARLLTHPGVKRMVERSSAFDAATFFGLGGFYRGATATAVERLLGPDASAPERVAQFLRAHPLGNTVEAGMLYDATHTLPSAWLHKVDRTSMAVSLEARSPFLDRRVLEFAFSLPLSMRIRGRQKKYIVRQLLREYLPDHLVDRPKQGFTAPVARWLREELRDELEYRLGPETVKRRGFFDPSIVTRLVNEHLSATHDHAQLLWALLVLEWWHSHHIEGDSIEFRAWQSR